MSAKRSSSGPDPLREATLRHRDLLVLRWIGEQYAARYDHLERLMGRSGRAMRVLVGRLRAARLIRTERVLVSEPTWATLTRAGLQACGLPFKELALRETRLAHVVALNDVRLHVQERAPQARWICERQLREEGSNGLCIPDGLAILDGRRVAIEAELTSKRLHVVQAKLETLEARYDAIVYFCAPKPHRQLSRIHEQGRWPKLEVRELPSWEERE